MSFAYARYPILASFPVEPDFGVGSNPPGATMRKKKPYLLVKGFAE